MEGGDIARQPVFEKAFLAKVPDDVDVVIEVDEMVG